MSLMENDRLGARSDSDGRDGGVSSSSFGEAKSMLRPDGVDGRLPLKTKVSSSLLIDIPAKPSSSWVEGEIEVAIKSVGR